MKRLIAISSLRIDGGTQPREVMSSEHVAALVEALGADADLPPVIVFHDSDGTFWLADGYHRRDAHMQAGRLEIWADVRGGSKRDAVLFSLSANAEHGLPRSIADKRRAVMTALDDPEWSKWSNHEIARRCKVSEKYVRNLRPQFLTTDVRSENGVTTRVDPPKPPQPSHIHAQEPKSQVLTTDVRSENEDTTRLYTNKHGKVAEMKVSAIGKKPVVASQLGEAQRLQGALKEFSVSLDALCDAINVIRGDHDDFLLAEGFKADTDEFSDTLEGLALDLGSLMIRLEDLEANR